MALKRYNGTSWVVITAAQVGALSLSGGTITSGDVNMDGGSVAYIRPSTTGGWARGFWWKKRETDDGGATRIGGIGVLGNNQSVSKFYIGYGDAPWTNSALEVYENYVNIKGNKAATETWVTNTVPAWAREASKPTYTASEVGALPSTGGTMTGPLIVDDTPWASGTERQALVAKFKTGASQQGAVYFGKEGPNSGSMIRLDQVVGTPRLYFRASSSAGAIVWNQPESGAILHMDLGGTRRYNFQESQFLPMLANVGLGANSATQRWGNIYGRAIYDSDSNGANNARVYSPNNKPSFSDIQSTPTTLSGYGITDALTSSGTLLVANGGTGATNEATARTNLGAATKIEMPQLSVPYRDASGTGEPNTSRLATMTSPLPTAILIRDANGRATFNAAVSDSQGVVLSQLNSAMAATPKIYTSTSDITTTAIAAKAMLFCTEAQFTAFKTSNPTVANAVRLVFTT